jgi:hypothetical protein
MKNLWRPFGALSFLAMLAISIAFVALRAVAQESKPATRTATPSAAEESATIQDDPIIAPDSSESADSNVSFPVDI